MAPKMPRHQTRIDRELNKIETCITNAKEARETKYGQGVHQYKAELEVYKRRVKGMKEELDADKNEEEIDAYDRLEEKIMDINLKIVAEIPDNEYYLVEKTAKKLRIN